MTNDTVLISTAYFRQLCKATDLLTCLEAEGVFQWQGYNDALLEHNQNFENYYKSMLENDLRGKE